MCTLYEAPLNITCKLAAPVGPAIEEAGVRPPGSLSTLNHRSWHPQSHSLPGVVFSRKVFLLCISISVCFCYFKNSPGLRRHPLDLLERRILVAGRRGTPVTREKRNKCDSSMWEVSMSLSQAVPFQSTESLLPRTKVQPPVPRLCLIHDKGLSPQPPPSCPQFKPYIWWFIIRCEWLVDSISLGGVCFVD